MTISARSGWEEILERFEDLEDPRSSIHRLHPLSSVVLIAILGVLAGANGPPPFADGTKTKGAFLERPLALPPRIPSKDVFRPVLMVLNPLSFHECFANWLTALRNVATAAACLEKICLALDGQADRVLARKGTQRTLFQAGRDSILHPRRQGADRSKVLSQHPGARREIFARAVRNHWSLENACHCCLDVTYREDDSRLRDENLLNPIPDKLSIARGGRMCGWSEEYLMEVVVKPAESLR